MKYKETILIILIIINVVLGIMLGIKNSKYKILSEDDKKYIETIKQLKQEENNLNIQISDKNNELSNINNKINQQNKILNGTAKYIMKINISQTHLTLSVSEHLKDAMNEIDSNFFKNSGGETVDLEIPKSMQHILSDYKRVLKENEELKNDYENLNNSVVVKNYCIKNSIPVQKVKDKIEEYKNMLKTCNKAKDIDIIEAKEANRQLSVELQKKDKIIDEIQKEVRDHIGFENRLKRDNKEPDLFNQGRFYVANNINNILKGK